MTGERPDWRLALRAALNGLVFVAPAAVIGEMLTDDDGTLDGLTAVLIAAVQVLGFCFAGWVVRRLVPASPLITSVVAGLLCFAIVQSVGIVTSLVRDQDLNPLSWVATALLATVAAAAGALLARVERAPSPGKDPS